MSTVHPYACFSQLSCTSSVGSVLRSSFLAQVIIATGVNESYMYYNVVACLCSYCQAMFQGFCALESSSFPK